MVKKGRSDMEFRGRFNGRGAAALSTVLALAAACGNSSAEGVEVTDENYSLQHRAQLSGGPFTTTHFKSTIELEGCSGVQHKNVGVHALHLYSRATSEGQVELENVELGGITCDTAAIVLPRTVKATLIDNPSEYDTLPPGSTVTLTRIDDDTFASYARPLPEGADISQAALDIWFGDHLTVDPETGDQVVHFDTITPPLR